MSSHLYKMYHYEKNSFTLRYSPIKSCIYQCGHQKGFPPFQIWWHHKVSNNHNLVCLQNAYLMKLFLWPPSTIFQLYRGGQFYGGGNLSTLREPVTSHWQILSHTVNQLIFALLCFKFFCFKTVSQRFNFAITKMLKVQIFHGMTLVYTDRCRHRLFFL